MKRSLQSYINTMERLDIKVIVCVLILNIYGLIMIYSASAYSCSISKEFDYNPNYLLTRQLLFVLVGLLFMMLFRACGYSWLQKLAPAIYIFGCLSVFLLNTSLGVESHNAVRWIRLGPVRIQIAEIVKIAVIVGIAAFMQVYIQRTKYIRILLLIWAMGFFPAILVWKISDNMSSAIIIAGITFGLTIIFARHRILQYVSMVAGIVAVILYRNYWATRLPSQEQLDKMSFRVGRICAWINPEKYASNQGMQPLQGRYAVASGGIFGKGLGKSIQKLSKIPEAQNDMIFSVVCEELGIVGAVILITLFVCLVYYLLKIAVNSEDLFGCILVCGIAAHIALQVITNIAVVVTLFPNTGVSLPFISYGGSAVFVTLCEIGVALSVNRTYMENQVKRKEIELEMEIPEQFRSKRQI